jgi:preprotein translocase subunit SecD
MRRLPLAAALFALSLTATPGFATPLLLGVSTAEVASDQATGQPVLSLVLTAQSAKDFAALTTANVGKVMDLRVDGKLVMSPVVRDPIVGGTVMVSGNLVANEAKALAGRIEGGARVEVEVESE